MQSMMQNHDTSNGLGTNRYELAHGSHCPFFPAYLECVAYLDEDLPST